MYRVSPQPLEALKKRSSVPGSWSAEERWMKPSLSCQIEHGQAAVSVNLVFLEHRITYVERCAGPVRARHISLLLRGEDLVQHCA